MIVRSCLLVLTILSSTAALAQEFTAYEGKSALREGEGGSKKMVEGVEFWSDGAPPRKFKLIGYIADRRHKSGLLGKISMSSLETDVAQIAKKNGGDAVIIMWAEAETIGVIANNFGSTSGTARVQGNSVTGNATGWNTGMAAPVQKQNSKFAVVQYLKDEAAATAASDGNGAAGSPAQSSPAIEASKP